MANGFQDDSGMTPPEITPRDSFLQENFSAPDRDQLALARILEQIAAGFNPYGPSGTANQEFRTVRAYLQQIYGPLPEGAVDYASGDLNGNGVNEVYAVDANGDPHTVYSYDDNNEVVATSYEDFATAPKDLEKIREILSEAGYSDEVIEEIFNAEVNNSNFQGNNVLSNILCDLGYQNCSDFSVNPVKSTGPAVGSECTDENQRSGKINENGDCQFTVGGGCLKGSVPGTTDASGECIPDDSGGDGTGDYSEEEKSIAGSIKDWVEGQIGKVKDMTAEDVLEAVFGSGGYTCELTGEGEEPWDCAGTDGTDGNQCWKDCVSASVLAGIPGLPMPPGAVDIGTVRDLENTANDIGTTIGNILDPDTDDEGFIQQVKDWVTGKIDGIFGNTDDVTLEQITGWITGKLGTVLGSLILIETDDATNTVTTKINEILGLPLTDDSINCAEYGRQGDTGTLGDDGEVTGCGPCKSTHQEVDGKCVEWKDNGDTEEECAEKNKEYIPSPAAGTDSRCGGCLDSENYKLDEAGNCVPSLITCEGDKVLDSTGTECVDPVDCIKGNACKTEDNKDGKYGDDCECIPDFVNDGPTPEQCEALGRYHVAAVPKQSKPSDCGECTNGSPNEDCSLTVTPEQICEEKGLTYDPSDLNADPDGCVRVGPEVNPEQICENKGLTYDPTAPEEDRDEDDCVSTIIIDLKCNDPNAKNYNELGECGECKPGFRKDPNTNECEPDGPTLDCTTITSENAAGCKKKDCGGGVFVDEGEECPTIEDPECKTIDDTNAVKCGYKECNGAYIPEEQECPTIEDPECKTIDDTNAVKCGYKECNGAYIPEEQECPTIEDPECKTIDDTNAVKCGYKECNGAYIPEEQECPTTVDPCDETAYALDNPTECGTTTTYTCPDPNATVQQGGLTPGACGPCKTGYVYDGAVERCVQSTTPDPCLSADYAAANPEQCGTGGDCDDCTCAEYAAANPEECATGPDTPSGGGGGGGGGGSTGGSGMFDLESFEIAGDPQLLARMEFPIENFLQQYIDGPDNQDISITGLFEGLV